MTVTAPSPVPTTDEIVAALEKLLPLLRRNAREGERQRNLTSETNEGLREAGVYRLFTPRRFGGYQVDLGTMFEAMRTIARADPSASWVAANSCVLAWWTAHFPDDVQEEVWVHPDVQFAGVIKPSGTLVPTDGGFILNGTFPFQTGSKHASWHLITTLRPLDDGTVDPYLLLLPISELKNLDDWHVAGMSGTGSHSVVAEDVFVPSYRAIRAIPAFAGEFPAKATMNETLYRCALMPTLFAGSYGTPIGAAQGMLEEWLDWVPKRTISWESQLPQIESPLTHLHAAEAAMKIQVSMLLAREGTALITSRAANGELMTTEERIRARVSVAYTTRLAREVAEILWKTCGATAADNANTLQRFFRDIEVITKHGVLDPDCNMALFGRSLVGLEPDTPFL